MSPPSSTMRCFERARMDRHVVTGSQKTRPRGSGANRDMLTMRPPENETAYCTLHGSMEGGRNGEKQASKRTLPRFKLNAQSIFSGGSCQDLRQVAEERQARTRRQSPRPVPASVKVRQEIHEGANPSIPFLGWHVRRAGCVSATWKSMQDDTQTSF